MTQPDHTQIREFLERVARPRIAEIFSSDEYTLGLLVIGLLCTDTQEPLVRKDGELVPALAAWTEMGVPHAIIATLLNEQGSWQYQFPQMLSELQTSLNEDSKFTEFLRKWAPLFQQVYEPVQTVLDWTAQNPKDGFNGHKFGHHVAHLIFLSQLFVEHTEVEFTQLEKNQYLLAVLLHDAGNIFSRSAHGIASVRILQMMFGSEVASIPELKDVLEAVLVHESKTAAPVNRNLIAEAEGWDCSEEERSQKFLELYTSVHSRIASMLRVIDKVDVGIGRILNTLKPTKGILQRDRHFLLNSVYSLDTRTFGGDPENHTSFLIEFDFKLSPRSSHIQPDAEFLVKKNRTRIDGETTGRHEVEVPDELRTIFKQDGTPYFLPLSNLFLHTYGDNIELIALDVLNVLKECERVVIRLVDKESGLVRTRNGGVIVNQPIEFVFSRATIMKDLEFFKSYLQSHPSVLDEKNG